ncbi:MAG: glycosyltransferase family 87 protein [Gemmatimonadales bacterium]
MRRVPTRAGALVAVAALAVALALAVPQGLHQRIGEDFAVFWQAGKNFASGAPLYHGYLPGARPLKYPPFAALAFTPLALFSLPVAATLVSLLNLALWVAAIRLTRDIIAATFPDRIPSRVPLALAALLSAQFFLDNFHHVQMNGVTLFLVLYGVRAYMRGENLRAAAALVTATALKITPVFFVVWLVLRGRRRAALAVFALALACLLVPLVLRGPARGAAELVEYYHTFLEGHQHGEVGSYGAGQNVAALVSRMTRPPEDAGRTSFRYLPASEQTAQLVYRVAWVVVLLAFVARLLSLRIRGAPVSSLELAMTFLAALLLSPITFTTHLVPLVFVFATALSYRPSTLGWPGYVLAAVLGLGMAASGLSGRDLAGSAAYQAVGGYSVMAWTMLVMFAAAVGLTGRKPAAGGAPAAPG